MEKLFFMATLIPFLCFPFHRLRAQSEFVRVSGNHFVVNGKPYYYIGTDYWYGPLLASEGEGGNRQKLIQDLDFMKNNGINNLRILVGAEGPDNIKRRVTPTLQVKEGEYNDSLLAGLDFLLSEMGKRSMYAVIYLGNTWDWSGGYSQYLNWNHHGKIPYLYAYGWDRFKNYDQEFVTDQRSKQAFYRHVKFIVSRTNRYTGKLYKDDPAIMAWQISNEPRALDIDNIPDFKRWIFHTASLIKSIDKNHLVSTGSEGIMGCEGSIRVYRQIHANRNIDYLTVHVWPKNWGWINEHNISGTLNKAIKKTNQYMQPHFKIGRKLRKPVVVEEFGLPRDHHKYNLHDSTQSRNLFYRHIFDILLASTRHQGIFAGCNFWAYGGASRPAQNHIFWKKGDDLMGDPPQEEQGLNSVFDTDSTWSIIKDYNDKIQNLLK